MKDEILEKKVK